MPVADLTWPEAFVYATLIASVALVFAVLVWSMFNGSQATENGRARARTTGD